MTSETKANLIAYCRPIYNCVADIQLLIEVSDLLLSDQIDRIDALSNYPSFSRLTAIQEILSFLQEQTRYTRDQITVLMARIEALDTSPTQGEPSTEKEA